MTAYTFGVEKSRAAVALISGFAALPTQQVFCPPFHADQEPWQRASESGTGNWNVHGPRDPGTMLITLCSLRTWTGKGQLRLFGAWRKPYFSLHHVM